MHAPAPAQTPFRRFVSDYCESPLAVVAFVMLVIILLIVLLLFGGKRLATLGGDLGSAISGFRKAMRDEGQGKDSLDIATEKLSAAGPNQGQE